MSAAGWRLRPAAAADARSIEALEKLFPGNRMRMASIRRILRVPTAQVWIVEGNGTVVGALMLLTRADTRYARIYSLAIAPQARGQGLGKRLLRTAERWAQAAGHAGMRLEVRASNRIARKLYAAQGYREIARLEDYYEDGMQGLRLQREFITRCCP
jgi:ribosomal protein S18 acetylase RimI-like enzyme